MKLWQKTVTVDAVVEQFTIGRDAEFDLVLAPWDVLGSLAHAQMLATVGILTLQEGTQLAQALRQLHPHTQDGTFAIRAGAEDVHSEVEFRLTEQLGDVGKKLHTGRSRNDQVLLDLRLYMRHKLRELLLHVQPVFHCLVSRSEELKEYALPGYTHFQVAMPSSFGLWLGAYAESLADDLLSVQAAYQLTDRNPLGSAAGYGSSFPLDRDLVTRLLGMDSTVVNSVYAQMGRGKTERQVALALAAVAATLGRLAMDATLYMCQNFGFISFPESLTTGSSIMPHKKNPDVFELIRGRCNRLQALPQEITLLTTNLPHGYHREMQLMKEHLFPAFDELNSCLDMTRLMLEHMQPSPHIMQDERYRYAYSVDALNALVQQGVPFRDAYKQVGEQIQNGTFTPPQALQHTHLGSIGNLGTARIQALWQDRMAGIAQEKGLAAEKDLLRGAS